MYPPRVLPPPPAELTFGADSNLNPIALVILIPLFDLLIYPGFRKIGISFSPIKKVRNGALTGEATSAELIPRSARVLPLTPSRSLSDS